MKIISIEISDDHEEALNALALQNCPAAEGETQMTGIDYFTTRINEIRDSYLTDYQQKVNEEYYAKAKPLPFEDRKEIMSLIDEKYATWKASQETNENSETKTQ